jgi:hypothetical protein
MPAALTFLVIWQAFACSMAQQTDAAVTPVAVADEVCAGCHEAIFRKYLNTPMANASGSAQDHATPGSLYHAPSKTTYRVYADDQSLWLTYARSGDSGRQKLEYFLGSGHLGMTYLYTINGYLLESPVAYYANAKAFNLALAECRLGQKDKALQVLKRVLLYSPDSPKAHERLQAIQTDQDACSPQ